MKNILEKMLLFCFSALLFVGGCYDTKPVLTEEEMALIPFSQTGDEYLPQASGGFVLAVNGETITSDEVVEPLVDIYRKPVSQISIDQFKAGARASVEEFVTNKMFDVLLYLEAKKQLGDNEAALDNAVDGEIRRFVISMGNDTSKAEADLKQRGLNWDSFREEQKKMILNQSYLSSQMPTPEPITYGQMLEVYDQIKEKEFKTEARLQFRLIDIQPDKLQLSDPNVTRQQAAKELAQSLLKKINDGEDFGELAKQYSHGYRRTQGGLWESLNPDSIASPYDVLAVEAQKIEVGQIAGPIEADGHIFIMKLEEKQAETVEPFENVQKSIEGRIRYNRQLIARKELTDKLMSKATIGNKDAFVDFCLDEIYRRCNEK